MFGEDGHETVPHREWVIAYEEVMDEVLQKMRDQGRQDEFLGSKVHVNFLPAVPWQRCTPC